MNLALESIYRAIDDATERMPTIVREPCPWCDGRGSVVRPRKRGLGTLERCAACAGTGRISVERYEGATR